MTHHHDVIIFSLKRGVQKTRSRLYENWEVFFVKMSLLSFIKPYCAYIISYDWFSKVSEVRKLSIWSKNGSRPHGEPFYFFIIFFRSIASKLDSASIVKSFSSFPPFWSPKSLHLRKFNIKIQPKNYKTRGRVLKWLINNYYESSHSIKSIGIIILSFWPRGVAREQCS